MENVGIFCGHLLYYSPFGYVVARKIWQPWSNWRKIEVGRAGFLRARVGLHTLDLGFCGLENSLNKSGNIRLNLGLGYTKWLKSWASALPTYNGDSLLLWGVENIMIIYLNGSDFVPPISNCLFLLPNVDATLFRPLIFLGSVSTLYILLYRPLFFSNVLDLILFGLNKGYCSCSPCHHFYMWLTHNA
jgi:hypothetical protein